MTREEMIDLAVRAHTTLKYRRLVVDYDLVPFSHYLTIRRAFNRIAAREANT